MPLLSILYTAAGGVARALPVDRDHPENSIAAGAAPLGVGAGVNSGPGNALRVSFYLSLLNFVHSTI